jgi:hypothetical protein
VVSLSNHEQLHRVTNNEFMPDNFIRQKGKAVIIRVAAGQ